MSALNQTKPAPGTCVRFVVRNAEEAARVIREQLGEEARVLSVRNFEVSGIRGLFSSPKLEVIAQIAAAPESAGALAGEPDATDADRTDAAAPQTAADRASSLRGRVRPLETNLSDLLRRSGFSESLLTRLMRHASWPAWSAQPLHRALVEVGNHLRELSAARSARTVAVTRAAFIGPAGVGRTTALCKWLSLEVFRRARLGHVVLAEFDRPNSPGPLTVFAEALGVPLARFPASTQVEVAGGFAYVDLPSMSTRDAGANAPLREFLDREGIAQRVLVLNAAYDSTALRAGYAAGVDLGATHVVFTHLDEVTQWGRLWDYLIEGELEPLFLATGPSLTADIETDVADAVARRTLPAAQPLLVTADADAEENSAAANLNVAA